MSCLPAVAALAASLGLAACAPASNAPGAGVAALYGDLGRPGAVLDVEQARAVISAYRMNAGLPALALDPELTGRARDVAAGMAAADRPASADSVKRSLAAAGVRGAEANLSAGYRTLAQAFSGWRDSPPHDRVLKTASARRLGIATAQAPGSKYAVYWALIVAP